MAGQFECAGREMFESGLPMSAKLRQILSGVGFERDTTVRRVECAEESALKGGAIDLHENSARDGAFVRAAERPRPRPNGTDRGAHAANAFCVQHASERKSSR